MYIVVIAWIYVVLMMSITEHSVVAGLMTFLSYGILPLGIILYITGSPARRRKRIAEAAVRAQSAASANDASRKEPALQDTERGSGPAI
jgi:hypothetical protein